MKSQLRHKRNPKRKSIGKYATIVNMIIVMVIICAIFLAALVIISSIAPRHAPLSAFELERRKNNGDKVAATMLHREQLLSDVLSVQRISSALLLVLFVSVAVAAFGWFLGIFVSVFVALEYGAIGRVPFVQRFSQKLYEKYEPALLRCFEKTSGVLRWVRSVVPEGERPMTVDSREELFHVIETSRAILTSDEKKLILHSLKFDAREVREIMTPRGIIDSISKKELLGPLVLDDLHKTGHSRFPVIDGDIDHVVGMLHIQELLTIDSKRKSTTVEKIMEPCVFYIREDQTLGHALAAFLRTHHHLFVVVNEFQETVGLLSLEDVIETMIGRKIIDEFDLHDDLRAVAKRNPRSNNQPEKRENV